MSIFTKVQGRRPKKSLFDLSHERKLTANMGDLIPVFLEETIPGDRFDIQLNQLVRMQALLAPLMHRVDVTTHFFFVPNRLIWSDWEDFITGGRDGNATPLHPTIGAYPDIEDFNNIFAIGSLADYLGLPVTQIQGEHENSVKDISALPFRAYQLIYNEYYRDQNLSAEIPINKNSGIEYLESGDNPNSSASQLWKLRRRAWRKDYFTSALPFAQRGPQVKLPLGDTAPVKPHPTQFPRYTGEESGLPTVSNLEMLDGYMTLPEVDDKVAFDRSGLITDLKDATGATINDFRRLSKLQQWLENNARGGARYIEQILSHFGVRSSDARLQRPEYLGGSFQPITISEVLQQSAMQDGTTPLGTMAGRGLQYTNGKPIRKFFEEHGFVIGIMSVMPQANYMQGLPRLFSRKDKFDYYWPEFATLGEQPIKLQELYYQVDPYQPIPEAPEIGNEFTFGYTPRFAEYKYKPSTVHGQFRTSLDYWHMARKFDNPPLLNSEFVQGKPPTRPFAVADQQPLLIQTYTNFKALRPMPRTPIPNIT